jgi:hypothetical protein
MKTTRYKKLHPATREVCERISQYLKEKRVKGIEAGVGAGAMERAAAIRQLPTYSQVRGQRACTTKEVQP